MTPKERFVVANGLRHRLLEWDGGAQSTLLLLHGFLDHAHTWEATVEHLPPGWHIVAPDWRGHGATEGVGAGGYYHFMDYVFDLADLVDSLGGDRVALCGHSMGGVVASLYAGAFPDHVSRLALVEGLGPEAGSADEAPARVARWIHEVRALRARSPRPLASLADAARRLQLKNPSLSEARALRLAELGTRVVPGGFFWNFDALHRTRSPSPFLLDVVRQFWRRVTCPVALIHGGQSSMRHSDRAERVGCFAHVLAEHEIEEAGHMVQIDAPRELSLRLRDFFSPVL